MANAICQQKYLKELQVTLLTLTASLPRKCAKKRKVRAVEATENTGRKLGEERWSITGRASPPHY